MRTLERLSRDVLEVPVAAARPYLLLKGTLLLLAFDVWLTRISHGGRYGAGGFNVAHWAWLDAIQPAVSPGLYIGVCVLTGMLCFALAIAPRPPRWLFALAFALHTWSWAMSMLDSYQHHYLLSIVLLALVFFPRLTAEEALLGQRRAERGEKGKKPRRASVAVSPAGLFRRAPTTRAWAYAALCASFAIVYAYTAYSKTADEWLAGVAFQRVLGLPAGGEVPEGAFDPIGPLRALLEAFGVSGDGFWWVMGHSVVLVQIICAAGYLLAPFRDVARSRAFEVFAWVALVTALSFHLGAEHMNLKIGWFSWYMVPFALVCLLPGRLVAGVARVVLPVVEKALSTELLAFRVVAGLVVAVAGLVLYQKGWMDLLESESARRFADTFLDPAVVLALGVMLVLATPIRALANALTDRGEPRAKKDPKAASGVAIAVASIGAIAAVIAGYAIDLPGAAEAMILGACAFGAAIIALLFTKGHARAIHPYGVAVAVAALAFFVTLAQSSARFDFYRNVGGDHRRRGELLTAYEAYVKANRYAPEGVRDRSREENELRTILEQRGELPRGRE